MVAAAPPQHDAPGAPPAPELTRGHGRLAWAGGWLTPHGLLAAGLGLLLLILLLLALDLGVASLANQRQTQVRQQLVQAWDTAGVPSDQRLDTLRQAALAAGLALAVHDGGANALLTINWPPAAPAAALTAPLTGASATWQLQVAAPVADLQQLQWRAASMLVLMAMGGLALAVGLAWRQRQRLRQSVLATLAQARSLGEAGYAAPTQLAMTELLPVVHVMDHLHQRMRALFDVHAEQLEALRRQAHTDALTGLPNRRHFLAVLEAVLSGEQAPAEAGMVMLRLVDLQAMNRRLGNAVTDRVLQAMGEVLGNYPQRNGRCAVGRLSGGDFGLLLPAGGVASETAQTVLQALRAQLARIDPLAKVLGGAVELRPPMGAAQALVMAQAALAGAESAALRRAAQPAPLVQPLSAAADDSAWQRRLARALVQGRVRLGGFPVRAADGRQVLLDSPLRVQLLSGGPYEPASRWLAQATRSRLNTAVDEKAVMLALAAIAQDGEARCINIAAASAESPEFVDALLRRLRAAPEAAACLWVDLPESLALDQPERVRELARCLRPMGTRVALEHCGEGLMRVPRLIDLGLDCVRIDGRFVNGIASDRADDARRYLRGLVRLVQSVGLSVTAEAVRAPEDLELLWHMGFDAATGPAVQLDLNLAPG